MENKENKRITSYIEKDVIIFECTASSDDFQENSELRERPDCTTNTEAVLKDNISHDINLDVPDTSKLQPIPSEAETNVTIPEATPTPSKKRKFILAGNTSEKKETHLNTLTNRLVNRKNFKDETDAKVFNKKK
ncbi:uncharacterized protein LOC115890862 [Sitophilus oryzae]|uniref:Uncharacterized protein LOC115890862 n=1 Tax=Sitophilus oryzae TaxID=7048 RepID=A0A6J2YUW4_SITOR|nr:uncharacterized protein LOC115890862 [Sitophilus oryzae]